MISLNFLMYAPGQVNVYKCAHIVQYPCEFSTLQNVQPWYRNSIWDCSLDCMLRLRHVAHLSLLFGALIPFYALPSCRFLLTLSSIMSQLCNTRVICIIRPIPATYQTRAPFSDGTVVWMDKHKKANRPQTHTATIVRRDKRTWTLI